MVFCITDNSRNWYFVYYWVKLELPIIIYKECSAWTSSTNLSAASMMPNTPIPIISTLARKKNEIKMLRFSRATSSRLPNTLGTIFFRVTFHLIKNRSFLSSIDLPTAFSFLSLFCRQYQQLVLWALQRLGFLWYSCLPFRWSDKVLLIIFRLRRLSALFIGQATKSLGDSLDIQEWKIRLGIVVSGCYRRYMQS